MSMIPWVEASIACHADAWEPAEKGRGPREDTCGHNSNCVMEMQAIVRRTFRVQ